MKYVKCGRMWKLAIFSFVLTIALWLSVIFCSNSNFFGNKLARFNTLDKSGVKNETNFVNISERKFARRKVKHHIPKFMLDLYERSVRNEESNQPDVVRSVIPKTAGFINTAPAHKDYQDNHLLIFDVPSTDEGEIFLSAELKILTIVEMDINLLAGLERIVKVSVFDDNSKTLLHLDEVHVYHTNNTWLSFNMTAPVSGLLNKNRNDTFLKIVISIKAFLPYIQEKGSRFKLSLLPIEEDFEHDYPVLLLTYSSSKENSIINGKTAKRRKARIKRGIEDDYEEETNHVWDDDSSKKRKVKRSRHSCRKRSLYVDFAEIQYDLWIVQPNGYEAYQCQGRCFYPVAEHLSPTKHAIVQALLHSVSPSKASRSCCVPTKLESISVLYIDNKGVLTYRYAYKDMVVTDCGCR